MKWQKLIGKIEKRKFEGLNANLFLMENHIKQG